MEKEITIRNARPSDAEHACRVFDLAIPEAFEQEGLGHLTEDIAHELAEKRRVLQACLKEDSTSYWFLVALHRENIVGTISYGPCCEDILNCTENALRNVGELGSLYIMPEYQGQGIGSALIRAAVNRMAGDGIQRFSLDSGYRIAQQKWLNKFGKPYAVVPDYWGPGSVHMVWLCEVEDYIGSSLSIKGEVHL